MSEFAEYLWGIDQVKRDLENDFTCHERQPSVAMTTFKELILSRPDVGFIRTDPQFAMRFLRARKFDAHDAFDVYVNYYRFMHSQRDFFLGYNINNLEIRSALEDGLPGVLDQRDQKGRRIMVMFASQWDPARYSLTTIHKAIYLSLDHLLNDQLVQEKGVILIIDWTGFTFRQCSKMQLAVLRIIVEGLEYGFPIRFKAIHCVGQSWYVETALALLKPFLRPSSRDKIRLHGHNLCTLHESISKDILSAELGGEKPPYQSARWIEQLISVSSSAAE